MPDNPQAEWQAAHDSLQALDNELNQAYDEATTQAQRDILDDLSNQVEDALTTLNREDMESRTLALSAAAADMKGPLDQLSTLRDQLNAVSAGFAKAASVISAIDTAVGDLSSYIK
jgi:DNA repair exonuclease SbcCD ATPase subunit